jgi:hypothetical protein
MQKVIIILSQFRAEGNAPQQLSLPLASVPQAELFSHKLQIPSIPGIPPVIPCDRCGKVQVLEGRCVGCGVERVANSLWKYFPNVGKARAKVRDKYLREGRAEGGGYSNQWEIRFQGKQRGSHA